MREFAQLHAMPETTLAEVEAKAARLHALTAQGAASWTLARACDLYVAAFLLPKRKGGQFAGPDGLPRRGAETVPTSGTIWEWMRGVKPFGPLLGAAVGGGRRGAGVPLAAGISGRDGARRLRRRARQSAVGKGETSGRRVLRA